MDAYEEKINALVLGAGKMGKRYASILSKLNEEKINGVPVIDNLIITQTSFEKAKNSADSLKRKEMRVTTMRW